MIKLSQGKMMIIAFIFLAGNAIITLKGYKVNNRQEYSTTLSNPGQVFEVNWDDLV